MAASKTTSTYSSACGEDMILVLTAISMFLWFSDSIKMMKLLCDLTVSRNTNQVGVLHNRIIRRQDRIDMLTVNAVFVYAIQWNYIKNVVLPNRKLAI